MSIFPIKRIPAGPRHIISGTDAKGNFVEYELTPEDEKARTGNAPPRGLTYEEWHSGTPEKPLGRYVIAGNHQVNDSEVWRTYVMVGEVVDEGDHYRIGMVAPADKLGDNTFKILKSDLLDPLDFSSLRDKSTLDALGVVDITATVLVLK